MLLKLMSSFFKMHFWIQEGMLILSENVISDADKNAKFIIYICNLTQ